MGRNATIGSLNFIACKSIVMRTTTVIGWGNIFRGPFRVRLGETARIGNRNVITCSPRLGGMRPVSMLWLAFGGRITGQHALDMMRSIRFGRFTHLAGRQSQIWTHSYVHALSGPARARIDGAVYLGDNVYVGAHSCINPGVRVEDSITIGSHSSVSTHLERPGLYVSQPLRFIDSNAYDGRFRFEIDAEDQLDPEVRFRRSGYGIGHR